MKIRDTKFSDYDISRQEEIRLKKLCRKSDIKTTMALYLAAKIANSYLASAVFLSLKFGVSFERVDRLEYLYISKNDFYGYRRKALWIFKHLIE